VKTRGGRWPDPQPNLLFSKHDEKPSLSTQRDRKHSKEDAVLACNYKGWEVGNGVVARDVNHAGTSVVAEGARRHL
jgi:hypothetical protein